MKSYQAHLASTNIKNPNSLKNNQILRSSAIFPFIINKNLDTKILFMGYWLMKRNIKNVTLKVSLRSKEGAIIKKNSKKINQIKAFSISVKNLLKFQLNSFERSGSIELEIFSDTNMVYPYPAIVVNYEGKNSSTVVHTCGRIYNNNRDFKANNQQQVSETGIDIIPNKNFFTFFFFCQWQNKSLKYKFKDKNN